MLVIRDLELGGIQLMALRMLKGLQTGTDLWSLSSGRLWHPVDLPAADEAESLLTMAARSPVVAPTARQQAVLLRRHVKETKPDVVFCLGYSTAAVASLAVHAPTVVGARNSPIELDGSGIAPAVKRALARRALRRAAFVASISSSLKEELVARRWVTEDKAVVVPNGVDIERLRRRAQESMPSLEPLPPRFLITVGRLSAQKDVGLLLAAFARLPRAMDIHLVVVGDGPERAALERQAREGGLAERVHFFGELSNPYFAMARAEALVLSSVYEGFATVLVEALALGVPVASVDCPSGPREVLADGCYGELSEQRTAASLAEALQRVLEPRRNRALREIAGERARVFSLQTMLQRYDQLLDRAGDLISVERRGSPATS